jgi:Tfp pilus assembly protein PilF
MSARYRIREHNNTFTPQKKVLGLWWRIAKPQSSIQAASEIIRHKLKAGHTAQPQPQR